MVFWRVPSSPFQFEAGSDAKHSNSVVLLLGSLAYLAVRGKLSGEASLDSRSKGFPYTPVFTSTVCNTAEGLAGCREARFTA